MDFPIIEGDISNSNRILIESPTRKQLRLLDTTSDLVCAVLPQSHKMNARRIHVKDLGQS